MSEEIDELQLLKPGQLGTWVAKRFGIWQMRFVTGYELGRIANDRGLMSFTLFGEGIKDLWQLALIRADLVESSQPVDNPGLILVDRDDSGKCYYADEREVTQRAIGFGNALSKLPEFPLNIELYFHPFRYYVLYQLDRILQLGIHPMQILYSTDSYSRLLDREISEFQQWSARVDFKNLVNRWNNITSLAIATEPCVYERMFSTFKYSPFTGREEQRKLIREHRDELKNIINQIGIEKIEKAREDLCINAEMLDPNKDVHIILRLTQGETRLEKIRGRLGGAIYLLTMAEALRRAMEDAFDTKLPEEDELGFGMRFAGIKEQFYGSSRILDRHGRAKSEFLRQFGLDFGVRLRWYVEGDTEYGALEAILGRYSNIDLVNLEGRIVAKGGKTPAFADNLESDMRSGVLSFVSVDGDREDTLRILKGAARDDRVFGRFFISKPDFTLANFTIPELGRILWELALEKGAAPGDQSKLLESIAAVTSEKELFKAAKSAVPALSYLNKGKDWGAKLMAFAWKNQEITSSTNGEAVLRPIVDAIHTAIRFTTSNYRLSRIRYRVDPSSGELVKKDP